MPDQEDENQFRIPIYLYGAANIDVDIDVDVDVDGVYERRPKPLCPHLEITLRSVSYTHLTLPTNREV